MKREWAEERRKAMEGMEIEERRRRTKNECVRKRTRAVF
jgi:hypothetical protein